MIRLLVLLTLLAVSAGGWLLSRPGDLAGTVSADETGNRDARYALSGAVIRQYGTNGRVRYEAAAESIEYFDNDSLQMRQVSIRELEGRQVWELNAPSGWAPPGERRILLQGPVAGEGRWPSGETFVLRADHVWVDSLRREIYTDSPVSLESPLRQLNAVGLRSDWSGRRLRLNRDVHARYASID